MNINGCFEIVFISIYVSLRHYAVGNSIGSTKITLQEVKRLRTFEHFVNPKKGCSIAEGFHFLYFPLRESNVRELTHWHI